MDTLISVTSKWQIHIPAEARQALGLKSPKTKLKEALKKSFSRGKLGLFT